MLAPHPDCVAGSSQRCPRHLNVPLVRRCKRVPVAERRGWTRVIDQSFMLSLSPDDTSLSCRPHGSSIRLGMASHGSQIGHGWHHRVLVAAELREVTLLQLIEPVEHF